MEESGTELTQGLNHSAAVMSSSSSSSSSVPPSSLDRPNFCQPFRHFAFSFSPDAVASTKRAGIPPIPPSLTSSSTVALPFHSRSLFQPLGCDSLPHLTIPTPSPPPSTLLVDPMLVDDRTPDYRTLAPGSGLPHPRTHRRSHSGVPFGLPLPSPLTHRPVPCPKLGDNGVTEVTLTGNRCKSEVAAVDDLIIAYMDSLDKLNSSGTEERHEDLVECSRMSGTRTSGADSSGNEAESSTNESGGDRKEGNKRSVSGDLTPMSSRHRRSFSMDHSIGKMHFGDESPKFPPSLVGQLSGRGSMDKTTNTFSLEFGNGEFNSIEMKKIMADEKLAEMALVDPKKVKRILANRLSASRSKERKMRYISELEHKVQTLQNEATALSAQLTIQQRDSAGLASQNNELKLRLQAMEQQAHLKNALNETLSAEVQRLKLATGEINEAQLSKNMYQPMQLSPQMFRLHQLWSQQQQQQQQNPLQTSQVSPFELPMPQQNQSNVAAKLESSKC
ncbi:bZIP transcription factor 29-like [Curcuma longa]|uniref:bZIP transcription factor 29-like n=1 Tax=Curcuma longa TaxID=136217 RepID=UPI003D9E38AF